MQLHNSLAFLYFSPTPQTQLSPPTPSTSISWQFPLVSMVTVWEGVGLGEGGGTVGKKKWTRNPIQAFPVLTLVCVCVSVCVYVCVCVCARACTGLPEVNCLRTLLLESITARPTPGRSAAVTPVCVKGLLLVLKCLLLSPLVYFTYFSASSVTLLYSLFYSLLLSFSHSALLLTFFSAPHTPLACFLILG